MKKIIAVLLSVVLLSCMLCPAVFASDDDLIQPLWDYVTDITGSIDISSGGIATIMAHGSAITTGVTKTTVTASLQQLNGTNWEEEKSWTASSNTLMATIPEKHWAVSHGYKYRLVVTLDAYNGTTLLESESATFNYGYFA